jgi:hypothetical protein
VTEEDWKRLVPPDVDADAIQLPTGFMEWVATATPEQLRSTAALLLYAADLPAEEREAAP